MATSTDVYNAQIESLLTFFFRRRETIINRCWTQCVPGEDLETCITFSRQECMDQLPILLHILTQRIAGDSQENDLAERIGQYGLRRWQRGYPVADLSNELDNFYDILDDEIQQFLALNPQTQPQVIAQSYRQLLRLSKDVSRESLLYVDRLGQMTSAEPVQPLQLAPDSPQQQLKQLVDYLQHSSHDLRTHLGIISTAADLIQQKLSSDERAKYMNMLSRNVKGAEHILSQLLAYAQQKGDKTNQYQTPIS